MTGLMNNEFKGHGRAIPALSWTTDETHKSLI
jgi:hypothetical protein